MQFLVTKVEFNFDDEELTIYEKADIIDDTIGQVWEADDENDLVEEVTCAYGWRVKSIDYEHILR